MLKSFLSAVNSLKEKSLYRVLTESDSSGFVTVKRGSKKLISFCCNDYFGLSNRKEVKKAAISAIRKYGVGARASRYVTGNNSLYTELEKEISTLKKTDDSIVFSSGYASAIGVIPALVGKTDLIVADRLIHSSLIDGSKLSEARLMRFRHNDIEHCREILLENRSRFEKCLIITETVFSMDGDVGRVSELLNLASEFDCLLLSDDAHGLGLIDQAADTMLSLSKHDENDLVKPRLEKLGMLPSERHLKIGTLSKAAGALGGYASGNKILIDYLRNFSKSVIYSTALPPAILAAAIESLKIIRKEKLQEKVLKNAGYFCELMRIPKSQSAIVPIIIGDNRKVLDIAKKVEAEGFLISAIRPPTVETGKARLRITFSAQHKKSQIRKLAEIIQKIYPDLNARDGQKT